MKRIINFLFSFICVCIFCVPAYVFTVDLGVESYVTDAGKAAGYDVANTDEFSLSKQQAKDLINQKEIADYLWLLY